MALSSMGILGSRKKSEKLDQRMDKQIIERVNTDRAIKPAQQSAPQFAPPTPFENPQVAPAPTAPISAAPAPTPSVPAATNVPQTTGIQAVPATTMPQAGMEYPTQSHTETPRQEIKADPSPPSTQPPLQQSADGAQRHPLDDVAETANNAATAADQDAVADMEADPELKKMADEYWRQVEESQKENQQARSFENTSNRDEQRFQNEIGTVASQSANSELQMVASNAAPVSSAQATVAPVFSEAVSAVPVSAPVVPAKPSVGRKEDVLEENRRDEEQRSDGWVVSCDANYASILANCSAETAAIPDFWAIGKLITIHTAVSRLIGMVYKVSSKTGNWETENENTLLVEVELMGELTDDRNGFSVFAAGISNYPTIGCLAHRIRTSDLTAVHSMSGVVQTPVGVLSQDTGIAASICLEKMISSHFAVVGTTGVGKSTSVSLLIRKLIEEKPDLRILILDPHNEFAKAFPNHAVVIDVDQMQLPFWMFQFEEIVEVIYRGRSAAHEEVDVLRDLIPVAKAKYADRINGSERNNIVKKPAVTGNVLTVDTPVPYKISDLLALIDEELGRLEGRHEKSCLKALKGRIISLSNDPRFGFLFPQRTVDDNMAEILSQIFRIPHDNKPITTFELSGIPSEVTNVVVSVLSRMAFDMAVMSRGSCEILVLCEEAHRYIPANTENGFEPTRIALARIAKEGRKYGAYLGIVTQRPSELDPTILSQCSTVFAMRLANLADQKIIKSAISNSSASTINFLSSIGNREAIAFGAGVATPMRMKFADLPPEELPESPIHSQFATDINGYRLVDIRSIVSKMRATLITNGEQDK